MRAFDRQAVEHAVLAQKRRQREDGDAAAGCLQRGGDRCRRVIDAVVEQGGGLVGTGQAAQPAGIVECHMP